MQLDAVKLTLPLKKTFSVSKGSAESKTTFLAIMNNRYNGEASGSVHMGPDDATIETELAKGIEILRSYKAIDLTTLDDITKFDIHPIAKSALSAMVLNFISGETNRYPWEVMSLGTPIGIRSSFTVSIDEPAAMIKSIEESKFPIIKIKMGNETDIMVLDLLDQIKDKEFRIDANGGWSCAKAEEMIFHLSQKGVKVIEQPTGPEFVNEWPHLKAKNSEVELIMDEGMNNSEDYEGYGQFIDGINIKMEKCGGILEGIKMARMAHADEKKVMLGCMVESSVGIAQSVYMSSLADYFDLDGPLLLQTDIADGIGFDREEIKVDREIIGGPKLRREIIQQFIHE